MKGLLTVDRLRKWFPLKKGFLRHKIDYIKAVDDISFEIQEGKVMGLVGQSGSGKTTIARLILGLEEPTAGSIYFNGVNLTSPSKGQIEKQSRRKIGSIFQDPFDSINPMMTIHRIVSEPLDISGEASKADKTRLVKQLLEDVKLIPSHEFIGKYPHELSGGQRQRVSLARSLILKPKLLVADEPLSMLDVSLRADMLNLMEEIKAKYNLTILFITHDLAVARYFCDDIAVIYKGKLVEQNSSDKIFRTPQHPYTKALKDAVPEIGKNIQLT